MRKWSLRDLLTRFYEFGFEFFKLRLIRDSFKRANEKATRVWMENHERWREKLPFLRKTYNVTDRQKLCHHLKGGRHSACRVSRDYNVSLHTFIDGRARVRCLTCGRVWWEGERGWKDALRMVDRSTNTPTSSEVPGPILTKEIPIEILRNKRG